jgi:hypothetical protein
MSDIATLPWEEAVWTAEFPKMADAVAFAARLNEGPGWYVKNVVQKGRKVTFERDYPADYFDEPWVTTRTGFMDLLDTVGYYGSTQSRKAKLNGVPAPMSY